MWIQLLEPATVPALAVFGIYIAYRQWRTANDKLNLDLFQQRLAVFKALRGYLSSITVDGMPDIDDDVRFRETIEQSKFLFGDDVNAFLKEVGDRGFRLRETETFMRLERVGEQYEKAKSQWLADLEAHRKSYLKMHEVFGRYMSFAHIRGSRGPKV